RLFHPAGDGGGGLAAELLVEDRARQRIHGIEAPLPARVRRDGADPLQPWRQPAVPLQVGPCRLRVEATPVPGHVSAAPRRPPSPARPPSSASRPAALRRTSSPAGGPR